MGYPFLQVEGDYLLLMVPPDHDQIAFGANRSLRRPLFQKLRICTRDSRQIGLENLVAR